MARGTCGTCGCPAEATPENEGYSDCCNDRTEYDGPSPEYLAHEAKMLKLQALQRWQRENGGVA